jgi:Tfp pilus assembly protein PilZ
MQAQPAPAPAPTPAAASPSQSGNVVVELGTHSPSNFYKGLSGNDVVEHGGLFVSTYKIPPIGARVNLRVLLPGDLEFQAEAVVAWLREPRDEDQAEPGFGARLTQIGPEGRQLVYRYTRNREPMFYDDL